MYLVLRKKSKKFKKIIELYVVSMYDKQKNVYLYYFNFLVVNDKKMQYLIEFDIVVFEGLII